MHTFMHMHAHVHTRACTTSDLARATTLRPTRRWMPKRATGRTDSRGFPADC